MMKPWTADARAELERALNEHHARLVGTGVDADEVVSDLRRHVGADLELLGVAEVGRNEMREVLDRVLDAPDADRPAGDRPAVASGGRPGRGAIGPGDRRNGRGVRAPALFWLALVAIPLAALVVELATSTWASMFFDPIGSAGRLLGVAFVPIAFAAVLATRRREWFQNRIGLMRGLAALATGVCGYFAVIFAPALPVALIGIVFFGLGLLPLAPFLGLSFGLGLVVQLRRFGAPPAWTWLGIPAGVLAMLVVDAPDLAALLGHRWLRSGDPIEQARGRAWLRSPIVSSGALRSDALRGRRFGGIEWLLDGGGVDETGSRETAGRAHFLATGTCLEDVPGDGAPWWRTDVRTLGARDLSMPPESARWLTLDSSRIDGWVDPAALVGYCEWTVNLSNSASWPLEGRAVIQLPAGGVVSRVTLWVDEEEREAAFASRAQAIKAYNDIAVVRRRDPILVTTAGPDRVRVRCFPVLPGGKMKFRLGVTFPLRPELHVEEPGTSAITTAAASTAGFGLPRFNSVNFGGAAATVHNVWIEGPTAWRDLPVGLVGETGGGQGKSNLARGSLRAVDAAGAWLRCEWGEDERGERSAPTGDADMVVVQRVGRSVGERRPVAIVVDGSPLVWRRHAGTIAAALRDGATGPVEVWLALDAPVRLRFGDGPAAAAAFEDAVAGRTIHDPADGRPVALPARGGFDNAPTVAEACASFGAGGGTVFWLHGAQINDEGAAARVRQVIDRRAGSVRVVLVPFADGRNDLAGALDGSAWATTIADVGASHLTRAFGTAAGTAEDFVVEREVAPRSSLENVAGLDARAVRHVDALRCATEILRRVSDPSFAEHREELVALAAAHQIVTPATGAVVLENESQYREHGLTPVDAKTVPTIPDAASYLNWVVVLVLIAAASFLVRRRGWAGAAWGARR